MLNYSSDRMDVNWYPAGFYIIEQGEVSHDLYLILSGSAKAVREEDDGSLNLLADLGPGTFFGEIGVAKHQRRKNHVIANTDVTCLILSMTEAVNYGGRGSEAVIAGGDHRLETQAVSNLLGGSKDFTTCIDVSDFIQQKISAMAAHRTQYPLSPDMFPLDMLTELMGNEYFIRVLPRPNIEKTLFP